MREGWKGGREEKQAHTTRRSSTRHGPNQALRGGQIIGPINERHHKEVDEVALDACLLLLRRSRAHPRATNVNRGEALRAANGDARGLLAEPTVRPNKEPPSGEDFLEAVQQGPTSGAPGEVPSATSEGPRIWDAQRAELRRKGQERQAGLQIPGLGKGEKVRMG